MSVRRAVQVGVSAVALAIGGLVALPAPAQAIPPNVIAVGPSCSLADAILSAQDDFSNGGCAAGVGSHADEIQLPPGTYTGPFTIPQSSGPVDLVGQSGQESTTILDGNGAGTTLTIAAGAHVGLYNLTITGGQGVTPAVEDADGGPGGLANAGNLDVHDVTISGNQGGGGALGADRFAGGNGHRGGAGGVGGFRNTGTVILQTVSITGNTGGAGGRGGQGGNAAGCHLLVGPPPFFICGIHAGNGGTGGPGGAGGATNTGVMHTSATITANTGGAGGAGGLGGAGVSESDGCEDGGYGGAGGAGGPGGLYVGDNTLVTGLATGITDNTGGQRGSGGAGATVGCQTKPSGFDGADGASDIRRGAQTLSWTSAPPDSGGPGATFTPTATSTATSVVGQVPVISVEDDCSIDSGTGEVTLTGSVGGSCTVDADEAGNDFFLPATRLSKTVSITDATPPVITPNIVGTPGSNGWYVSDVTLTWTVTDPESVVSGTTGCDEVDITADQASTDYTCEATSAGGTDHTTVSIKRDATAPTLAPSVSPNPVPLGGSATASANATDSGSGVDTASVQCGAVSTSAVGTFTVSCSASDLAGNASGDFSASYTVAAPFGSFLTPLPRSTYSKSGSVIPVKFTLRNATGPLSAAASSALAAHGQVRAILTQAADGSGTKLAAALCGWDATHGNFICTLKSPKMKNVSNPYYVTVQEAGVGSTTWFNAPSVSGASGAAVNPVQIGFK